MFIVPVYYEIKRVSFAKVTLPYSYTMRTSVDASEESDQSGFCKRCDERLLYQTTFCFDGHFFLMCREVLQGSHGREVL